MRLVEKARKGRRVAKMLSGVTFEIFPKETPAYMKNTPRQKKAVGKERFIVVSRTH